MNKKLLAGICLVGLSGCAGNGQPGPNTPPAVDHSFSSTRGYLTTSGICDHPQDSDPYRRNAPKEVRCLGGTWDSVALMVSGRDATGNELDKVRLLWRDWKPGMHLGNDKEAAAKFVAVLAERYISPRNRVKFAGDFLDGDSGQFRSGDFEVSMNAKDQGRYILHRVELKNLTKRGTSEAPAWVPPSPPKGDYIAPVPAVVPQPESKPAQPQVWVNPNPAIPAPQPIVAPVPEPVEVQPQPVVPVPVEEIKKPTPPLVPPKDEIIPPNQPVYELMNKPAPVQDNMKPVPVPQPVVPQQPEQAPEEVKKPATVSKSVNTCTETRHENGEVETICSTVTSRQKMPVQPEPQQQPAPVVETPIAPQPVAPIQPPMERQRMSPAELIPNFPMDEEENYIFKEFDGEIGNDL